MKREEDVPDRVADRRRAEAGLLGASFVLRAIRSVSRDGGCYGAPEWNRPDFGRRRPPLRIWMIIGKFAVLAVFLGQSQSVDCSL